jgi:hypothetical protein
MASFTLRALFLFKAPQAALNAQPQAPLEGPFELMGALRAKPRAASMAKAREALLPHYRIDPVGDASRCQPWGLEVLHFELTPLDPGMDFPTACERALDAMKLRVRGAGPCRRLSYPSRDELAQDAAPSDFGALLALHERRVASIYRATSCALERAQIESALAGAGARKRASRL